MTDDIMVGIDFTSIFTRKEMNEGCFKSSITIFTADIIDGFIQNRMEDYISIFAYSWGHEFLRKRFPGVKIWYVGSKVCDCFNVITGKNIYSKINADWLLRRSVKRSNVSVLWNPFVRAHKGPYSVPYVVTIHDLIEYESSDAKFRNSFKNTVNCADHIVTITDYVKKSCASLFDEAKMTVIPNAIHLNSVSETKPECISRDFILNINAFRSYKNAITLIRAFGRIREDIGYDLVLCGGGKEDIYFAELNNEISKLGLGDRVKVLYKISDSEIEWLYHHAILFVNPSLKEGFGRTPVEAALRRVPVLTTKETSLYEVTLGLLDYIDDPYDDKEMAEAILRCISRGPSYDIDTIEKRYKEDYDPKRIALLYRGVFDNIVKGGTNGI